MASIWSITESYENSQHILRVPRKVHKNSMKPGDFGRITPLKKLTTTRYKNEEATNTEVR